VLRRVLPADPIGLAVHVAPENAIAPVLRRSARRYLSTDLDMPGVTVRADLRHLPLPSAAVDVLYASHVLEHIPDDLAAIEEIHRVLAPEGMAILPVPISGDVTVEYPAPRPEEHGHMRSPGMDYLARFTNAGFSVEMFRSNDFDWRRFQLKVFEPGGKPSREDLVPVCRKPAPSQITEATR
jgi:SAM-dependent methyltransferase